MRHERTEKAELKTQYVELESFIMAKVNSPPQCSKIPKHLPKEIKDKIKEILKQIESDPLNYPDIKQSDLAGRLPDEWREYNKELIPVYIILKIQIKLC